MPRLRGKLIRRALAVALAAGLVAWAAIAAGFEHESNSAAGDQIIIVRGHRGKVLARVPLHGDHFAVSYRNSIYETPAEERYRVLPQGRFRLVQLAAAQLAVLEEYYAISSAPRPAPAGDRRQWIVPPDDDRSPTFERLSIAATDLGQRTIHVPGEPPLALWKLVGSQHPFVALSIEER